MSTTFGRIFKNETKEVEQKPVETVETLATTEKELVETTEKKSARKKNSTKE